jgi:hypothetical protein
MSYLDIALGRDYNQTFEHKFGANRNLTSGTQSIWTQGGLYPWSALDNPQTLYLISTSTSDTASIEIIGLDNNYLPLSETVTLTGTAAKATQNQFKRVFRMVYSATNAGTITARTVSGTGTVVAHMEVGTSQTLMAVYTVPANVNAYGTQFTVGIGKGGDASFKSYVRDFGGAFRIRGEIELYQNTFTQTYSVPIPIGPKSDIDFRATTSGNNFPATASFDLIFYKR